MSINKIDLQYFDENNSYQKIYPTVFYQTGSYTGNGSTTSGSISTNFQSKLMFINGGNVGSRGKIYLIWIQGVSKSVRVLYPKPTTGDSAYDYIKWMNSYSCTANVNTFTWETDCEGESPSTSDLQSINLQSNGNSYYFVNIG